VAAASRKNSNDPSEGAPNTRGYPTPEPLTDITVADEVVTADRVAFSVDCVFPDGKRIFEHVIAHIEDSKIVRQVDVEAWDW
jgi:hypothetical protein